MAILDDARPRRALSTRGLALASAFSLTLVVPLAAMNPWVSGRDQRRQARRSPISVTSRHPDDVSEVADAGQARIAGT